MRNLMVLVLSMYLPLATGCVVEEARAQEEHRHACRRTTDVPSITSCCRMSHNSECVLKGKALCYDRACSCGRQCSSDCVTACMPE